VGLLTTPKKTPKLNEESVYTSIPLLSSTGHRVNVLPYYIVTMLTAS
jgi:hypothetical protein